MFKYVKNNSEVQYPVFHPECSLNILNREKPIS